MDAGKQLLSRIVDDSRITEVTRSGITAKFLDEDSAIVFNHVIRHFNEYKSVPSRDAVLKAFPTFDFKEAKEPLEYYINEVKEAFRRHILEENLKEAAKFYQKDTHKTESLIRHCLTELQITDQSFKDIDFAASVDEILQEYTEKKENPGVQGIRSTWNSLDNETLGWQPGELAVLAGEKYMGKSWLMIFLAAKAALQGERVVFCTREMSQKQVRRRASALLAQVNFDRLRKGTLTNAEEQRFDKAMQEVSSEFRLYISQSGIYTVEDMERKAVEKDATLLLTDSVYLFQPDASSKRLGEVEKRMAISQRCKLVAQNLHIPFIISVQAGRRKTKKVEQPTLDNIEWSNAFSQDGDTVFFIQKDDVDKEMRRAQLWLLKSRDGQETDFYINQDFEMMDFAERSDRREPTTEVFEEDEGIFS